MDRRGFFGALAGLAAAPLLPAMRPPFEWGSYESVRWVTLAPRGFIAHPDWYAIVHPSVEQDLRNIAARDQWYDAYRAWRKASKPAVRTLRHLLLEFGEPTVFAAEEGCINGFKLLAPQLAGN